MPTDNGQFIGVSISNEVFFELSFSTPLIRRPHNVKARTLFQTKRPYVFCTASFTESTLF